LHKQHSDLRRIIMAAYISFQPKDYYSTKLYTGTGAELAVTGTGFTPDFTWLKARTATENHMCWDTARGATKVIYPNTSGAEVTETQGLKSFDSDGYTLGTWANLNTNTFTYASWNWKGGTTTGIATNGSTTITPSSYSFNQTSGFSVLKYTGNSTAGAKLAHGLGSAPKMVIIKGLTGSPDWNVYHAGMGNTKYMELNATAAATTSTTRWNDTTPDSVNITLGDSTHVNDSSNTFAAYCFAEKKGFSKCGTFVGNNSATDGPFVYTGFRPAFVLVKVYDYSAAWTLFDDRRIGYNPTNEVFSPDTTITSRQSWMSDIYSNGFKPFNNDPQINGNGTNYIYLAFSEFPTVSSNDVPGLAR